MMADEKRSLIELLYQIVVRPDRVEEIFNRRCDAVAWVKSLPPELDEHFLRAAHAIRSLHFAGAVTDSSKPVSGPVVRFDGSGQTLAASASAVEQIGRSEAKGIESLPFDRASIEKIRQVVAEDARAQLRSSRLPAFFRVAREGDGVPLTLSVRRSDLGDGTFVLRVTEAAWTDELERALVREYGLTAAETAVLRLLFEGHSAPEAAERRTTSVATVRAQIRSLYEKTGAGSQNDIIRLVASRWALLSAQGGDGVDLGPGASSPAAAQLAGQGVPGRLRLPDNRQIEFRTLGKASERTCVFLSDIYSGESLPQQLVGHLERENWRIVLPSRSRSAGDPLEESGGSRGRRGAEKEVDAIVAVLKHLSVQDCIVLSVGGGALIGHGLERSSGPNVRGLVHVAPDLPVLNGELMKQRSPFRAMLIACARHRPALLQFLANASAGLFVREGAQPAIGRMFNLSPPDREWLQRDSNASILADGLRSAVQLGEQGLVESAHQEARLVQENFRTASAPVHVVVGDQDPEGRPVTLKVMQSAGYGAAICCVPDAGALILHSHPEVVWGVLRRMEVSTRIQK